MISPKVLKDYFSTYPERVTGITDVFCLVKESEIQKSLKSLALGRVALVLIVPSFDTVSPDRDNIRENSPVIMFLVKKVTSKDDTEEAYLDVLHDMMVMLQQVRTCIMDDKRNPATIMRHFDANGIHTDPEIYFYGCFGWSMGFNMNDDEFY